MWPFEPLVVVQNQEIIRKCTSNIIQPRHHLYFRTEKWRDMKTKNTEKSRDMKTKVRLGYCYTPYQRLRLYNGAPFSRLLRHAGDTEDVILAQTPGVPWGDEGKEDREHREIEGHEDKDDRGHRVLVMVNWLFNVTINDISVIHVTAHKCAGGMKKLYLRSGS